MILKDQHNVAVRLGDVIDIALDGHTGTAANLPVLG
jgi:hypothetical protein